MKILLLEDDHLLNSAICKFLTLKGHKTCSFRDGRAALKSIEEEPYDLLLLDINVPHINGLMVLENLQKQKIQLHTIFISAIIDIEYINQAFHLGCDDYLKKPFHLRELELRIDKLLESSYIPNTHLRLSSNYSLDRENNLLLFRGKSQSLSQRHLKIITLLANNRNRVVDYYLFQEYAWDNADIGVPTIRAEINRLKKNLNEDIILNIRNMGYMIKTPPS